MNDGAAGRRGFDSVVVGCIEQSAGHFEADGSTDYKSADEEDNEGLCKIDDHEVNNQSDEATTENILMELLLKRIEDQAAEHTADEEYSHRGAGKSSGTHATLSYNEGDVRTHNAIGIDEHKNNRAKQPCDGGNLKVTFFAACLSRLVCGEIDASKNKRNKSVKESEISVIPSLSSKNTADGGKRKPEDPPQETE